VSRLMTEVEAETCVSRPNLPRAESKNMRQLEKFGSLCSSTTETWERMLTVDGVDVGVGHQTRSIYRHAGGRRGRGGLRRENGVKLHGCGSVWMERRRITTGPRYHEGRENKPTHFDYIDLHV
jgi:hypothetical protein